MGKPNTNVAQNLIPNLVNTKGICFSMKKRHWKDRWKHVKAKPITDSGKWMLKA